jgi:hypothetical protein
MDFLSLLFASLVGTAAPLPHLQIIPDAKPDCGCTVYRGKNRCLVVIGPLEKDSALVMVEGRKRRLKFVSSTKPADKPKKGERYTEIYENDDLELKLDYRVTSDCKDPKSKSCAVGKFTVDTLLQAGKSRSALNGLRGECGC